MPKAALLGLPAPGMLHIATHGVFQAGPVPALARSALALALAPGARHCDAGDSDCLVTALEVADMDLWGTQLAFAR